MLTARAILGEIGTTTAGAPQVHRVTLLESKLSQEVTVVLLTQPYKCPAKAQVMVNTELPMAKVVLGVLILNYLREVLKKTF